MQIEDFDAISSMDKNELRRRIEADEWDASKIELVIFHWIKIGRQEGEKAQKEWESKLVDTNLRIQLLKAALGMK